MTTPEELALAVEAAAEALHEASDHGHDGGVRYGYLCNCREKARLAVEAAAPYLRVGPNLLSDTWQQRAERAEAEVERLREQVVLRDMGVGDGVVRSTWEAERALADCLAEALQGMNYQLIGPDQLTPEPWKKRKAALAAYEEARREV